jgi:arylsulfatase A-like enzyme
VRWTGVVPVGRVTEQPAITMDWTATILSVTGTKPDPGYPLDGEDLLPVCRGARPLYDRTFFWRTQSRDAARVGNWKYLKDSGNERLFDLSVDPGEKNDLRSQRGPVFEKIRDQYLAWNAQMLPRRPPA